MICGHYKNKPLNKRIISSNKESEIEKSVISELPYQKDMSSQLVEIDLKKERISFNQKNYNCFVSEKTTPGDFFVAEKWEFPYWKKNGVIYTPNYFNPIGEFLIILGDKKTLRKIPQSIHAIPMPPFGRKRKRCIRMEKDDLEDFFNNLDLGASVQITK
ncbi:MAG: L,D-transpeptidase [Nanoarchaeota archaeon]